VKVLHFAAAAALLMVPALAWAQGPPDGDEHRGPPPESIAACKDKSEGDACEFDSPRDYRAGTCHRTRATGDLACLHPHHDHDAGSP
jgi:hypothetical protein